ncbi:RING finger and SPRY domain-containing protein 1 [Trichinella spiralis]|uniref:RING finger and SPRY domain-containing protein 1 n=1 Tax=Trichinella spiralis TaxID=6334 RepID=A0ABR3KPZ7_TRISP
MGQCLLKPRNSESRSTPERRAPVQTGTFVSDALALHSQRLRFLGLDVKNLILETLSAIRHLVNNDQELPSSMLKLNLIAENEEGWLLIVKTMIESIPLENPLGPVVITLFLDESPLPTKESVRKLLSQLDVSYPNFMAILPSYWHRNLSLVLGCIAEKLAGPYSVAVFQGIIIDYLLNNLHRIDDPLVILFSLIALEKFASTCECKLSICNRLASLDSNPLLMLEGWLNDDNFCKREVGFCAQWALDNVFVANGRVLSYLRFNTDGINVMLNHNDVSEYLKLSPDGLEARSDVSSFESVRCTFQVSEGVWYYEALIVTSGVMQIGWATKNSKFLNLEGYGIGDDEFSVSYDGCRQLIWHNANSVSNNHPQWKPGDILGCLLNMDSQNIVFYLNGKPISTPHCEVFAHAKMGFFAAASFMSFQQCRFNFGKDPFLYPPDISFCKFNDYAILSPDQKVILPRKKKMEELQEGSVPDGSCHLCYDKPGLVVLQPCHHRGICAVCASMLERCPFCRAPIEKRCL